MNNVDAKKPLEMRNETWHLGRTVDEENLARFEFSLEQAMHAYYRWKSMGLAVVSDGNFSGNDAAVLNIIRLKDRSKGLSEICRLLNREDTANIQYSIRKLLKAGLITMTDSASRKTTSYEVSALGRSVTDDYAEVRRSILLPLVSSLADHSDEFEAAQQFLNLISGIYDQAAKQAAASR